MGGIGSGPRPGNVNAVRHGARSDRGGIVLAKLGKRFAPAYRHAVQLRRAVESLISAKHGSVPLLAIAKISTLCRLEVSCRASELAIRDTPNMTADELRQHRSMIVQWSCQRDRLLASLVGDEAGVTVDPWAEVDLQTPPDTRQGTIGKQDESLPVQADEPSEREIQEGQQP